MFRTGILIVAMFFAMPAGAAPMPLPKPVSSFSPASTANKIEHEKPDLTEVNSRGSEARPLVVTIKTAPEDQARTQKEAKYKESEAANNRIITTFTVVLGVAAILQFGAALLQWDAMRRQESAIRRSIVEARRASNRQSRETRLAIAESKAAAAQQSKDMRDSISAAQKAADAAELNAQIAVTMNLPVLHIESIRASVNHSDLQGWLENFVPVIVVKNYGATPAFVTDVVINATIITVLPDEPDFHRFDKYPDPSVIDSRQEKEYANYLIRTKAFSKEEMDAIIENRDNPHATGPWVHVFGYIDFMDFMGKPHRKGFAYYRVRTGRFVVDPTKPNLQTQT